MSGEGAFLSNAGAVIPSEPDTGAGKPVAPARSGDLLALADRCEQATDSDRDLDGAIAALCFGIEVQRVAIGPDYLRQEVVTIDRSEAAPISRPVNRFTASVDAAMTLIPDGWALAGMQDAVFNLGKASAAVATPKGDVPTAWARYDAKTPALALCAAALHARAAASAGS